jgi:AcrR family transcriptional regulator
MSMTGKSRAAVRSRGRPRSEEVRLAILQAAGALILKTGIEGFTIEGVAERAGASKVTIYKWWPSKGALALDGFFASVSSAINTTLTNDAEADLVAQAESVVHLFRDTSVGRVLAGLIGEAQWDPDLASALRERWLDPRRETGAAVLRAAKVRGEISPDVDTTIVLDQIYGAIYIRLLLGHAPMPDGMVAELVHNVMHGIRLPGKSLRIRKGAKRRG